MVEKLDEKGQDVRIEGQTHHQSAQKGQFSWSRPLICLKRPLRSRIERYLNFPQKGTRKGYFLRKAYTQGQQLIIYA